MHHNHHHRHHNHHHHHCIVGCTNPPHMCVPLLWPSACARLDVRFYLGAEMSWFGDLNFVTRSCSMACCFCTLDSLDVVSMACAARLCVASGACKLQLTLLARLAWHTVAWRAELGIALDMLMAQRGKHKQKACGGAQWHWRAATRAGWVLAL